MTTNLASSSDSKVRLQRLAYVVYQHEDLTKTRQFGQDFGWKIAAETADKIYFAGYGSDPYCNVAIKGDKSTFRGTAWLVESAAELEKATKLPGASNIASLDGPAGGQVVTLKGPYGYDMHLVHGWTEKTPTPPTPVVLNHPADAGKPPRAGTFQRFEQGPALINKIGHWGYITEDFKTGSDWYRSNFNLRYSDVFVANLPNGQEVEVSAFFRLDRGEEYVDHHCFFLMGGPPGCGNAVHHSSYEIADFDQQAIGHAWLESKSYELSWGIGRHVLGSQIFDYWLDVSGFRVEHYCDGDVLNNTNETGRHLTQLGVPPEQAELASWAMQPLGPAFTEIRVV